jgi:fused signal recognition particle receptor
MIGMGFLAKLKEGLAKTKNAIFGRIDDLFKHFHRVDEELFEELEEVSLADRVRHHDEYYNDDEE